jgi:L-ascorbate metabolism protein UlaG (beta-lactamase superfamily)
MRRSRAPIVVLLFGIVAAATVVGGNAQAAPAASQPAGEVKLEWFGWSHFRFTSPTGKVILTNPFTANPDSPIKTEDITQADLILVPNGHGDEVGSAVQIAQATGARVYTPFELGTWLIEQGVPMAQVTRSNPGERLRLEGITVRMVTTQHGSGLSAPSPTTPYGGPAAGFVITFENGYTVYFAGSAPASMDQQIWAELYKPDMAILHMGGAHEPLDIAYSAKLLMSENPNLKTLIPHHNRVNPPAGQVTVADVQQALDSMGIALQMTQPPIGEAVSFSKP